MRIDYLPMRTHVHIGGTSSKKTKKLILCDVSGFGSSPKIENFYPGGSILFEFTVMVQDSRFKVQDSTFKTQEVSLGILRTYVRMYVCTYVRMYVCTYVTYVQRTRDREALLLEAFILFNSADAMKVSSKQRRPS